jgi:PiT family inorganic phosphate transporter
VQSPAALIVIALLFVLVTGANDGGALLSTGLKLSSVPPWAGLAMLTASVVVVPLTLGIAVALTFTSRLVDFGADHRAVLAGVGCAVVVVVALTALGRPTSLTLATVGGLTGAGLGAGLPVSGGWVGFVLLMGVAAPLAGAAVAVAVSRLLGRLPPSGPVGWVHRAGFALLCTAYAVNDGQKMLAVFALAFGRMPGPGGLAAIAALFALGAAFGLPAAGRALGGRLVAVRPVHAAAAGLSAACSVLGCAALGTPVSMTQAAAGALIAAHGTARVRWHAASRIVLAWLVTLPGSMLLGAAVTGALG